MKRVQAKGTREVERCIFGTAFGKAAFVAFAAFAAFAAAFAAGLQMVKRELCAIVRAFAEVKGAFDPAGIMNPG